MSMAGLFRSMGLLSSTHPRAETANSAGLNPEPENLSLSRRPCVGGSRAGRSLGKSNALAPTPSASPALSPSAPRAQDHPSPPRISHPSRSSGARTSLNSRKVTTSAPSSSMAAAIAAKHPRRTQPITETGRRTRCGSERLAHAAIQSPGRGSPDHPPPPDGALAHLRPRLCRRWSCRRFSAGGGSSHGGLVTPIPRVRQPLP